MGLYNFQARFVPFIESGAKMHTIRATRKHPDKVGSTLHLYTGLRQRGARLIKRVPCVDVQSIVITDRQKIFIDGVKLAVDECDVLAKLDGFTDFADMMSFWQGRLPFVGQILHWSDAMGLKPDFSALQCRLGGYTKELPEPHIFQYGPNSPARRPVRLRISTWVGSSALGAKHVYVSFEVAENYIWDSRDGMWTRPWDCEIHTWREIPGSDQKLSALFLAENRDRRITKWVRTMLDLYPEERFDVTIHGEQVTKDWSFDEGKYL